MATKKQEKNQQKYEKARDEFDKEIDNLAVTMFSQNQNVEKIQKILDDSMAQYIKMHPPYSYYNMFWASKQLKELFGAGKAKTDILTYPANFKHWTSMKNDNGERVRINVGATGFFILRPNIMKVTRIEIPLDDPKYNELMALKDKDPNDPKLLQYKHTRETPYPKNPYTPIKVYDVSQTNAVKIGAVKIVDWSKLGDDNELRNKAYEKAFEFLANTAKNRYDIEVKLIDKELVTNGLRGSYDGNTIRIQEALPINLKVKTMAHELGHHICGHADKTNRPNIYTAEIQADIFAYVLTNKLGLTDDTTPHLAEHLIKSGALRLDAELLGNKSDEKQLELLRTKFKEVMRNLYEPFIDFMKESKFQTFMQKEIAPLLEISQKQKITNSVNYAESLEKGENIKPN